MSRPPALDNPGESPQPELRGLYVYAVVIHIQSYTDADDIVEIAGVYMNFKDAVTRLKNQRLTIEDGFVVAHDAESRDRYPFCNKIRELRKEDETLIGWGYHWWRYGELDNRVWIRKTKLWPRSDENFGVDELSDDELQELGAEGDIDYVAYGQGPPGGF